MSRPRQSFEALEHDQRLIIEDEAVLLGLATEELTMDRLPTRERPIVFAFGSRMRVVHLAERPNLDLRRPTTTARASAAVLDDPRFPNARQRQRAIVIPPPQRRGRTLLARHDQRRKSILHCSGMTKPLHPITHASSDETDARRAVPSIPAHDSAHNAQLYGFFYLCAQIGPRMGHVAAKIQPHIGLRGAPMAGHRESNPLTLGDRFKTFALHKRKHLERRALWVLFAALPLAYQVRLYV